MATHQQQAIQNIKNPQFFIKNILKTKLWSKQREIVDSVWKYKRTTVKACHGVGKTMVSGNILLAFLFSKMDSIVITTAPTWRQVEKLLWKEVRAAYSKSSIKLGGSIAPKSPELQILQDQWYAMGLSTDNPDKFQGFHAKRGSILVIVDEAAGVESKIFDGIEGILSSEDAHLLLIGNPTNRSGEFFKSFRDKSYNQISISAFDSPNFKQTGITESDIADGSWMDKYTMTVNRDGGLVAPFMVTPEWVADKYARWKPGNVLYESKVKANFPDQGEDSLIPMTWVEAAMERWEDIDDNESTIREMGVDVAEFGGDESIIAKRFGRKCTELIPVVGDEMKLISYIRLHYHRHSMDCVKVDGIGVGHPVISRAKEIGLNALCVKSSWSPCEEDEMEESFANLRAQLYWNLRCLLDPNRAINPFPIGLPRDEMLLQELSEIKWKPDGKGRIQIEDKDAIRKRMGRSPDRADAVVILFAPKEWLKEEGDSEPKIWLPNI